MSSQLSQTASIQQQSVEPEPSGLDPKKVFSGVRWTGFGQVATETTRLIISVVLARLLAPQDFGLLSMASVVTGFVMIFQYMGSSAIVIQRKDLTVSLTNSLFVLNVIASLILSLALIGAAPWLAGLYHEPQLVPIIQILGISFVVTAVGTVPGSLLNRNMQFDKLARAALYSTVLQGVVAVFMALMGFGVWALVISSVLSSILSTVYLWTAAKWKPTLVFDWPEFKGILGFSLNLTGLNLVDYTSKDVDKFLLGRYLGEAALGFYTMAYRFTLYPPAAITPVLSRVLFPTFSKIQDDYAQMRTIYLRSIGAITFITLPLIVGIMVVANPFVEVVLGNKWMHSVAVMIWLAPIGIFHALSTPAAHVMLAKGKAAWLFHLSLFTGLGTIGAFLYGMQWGLIGAAIAYSIITLPLTAARFWLASKLLQMGFGAVARTLWPYVASSFVMAVAIYGARLGLMVLGLGPLVQICVAIPLGALTYLGMSLWLRPPALFDFIALVPSKIRTKLQRFLPTKEVRVP